MYAWLCTIMFYRDILCPTLFSSRQGISFKMIFTYLYIIVLCLVAITAIVLGWISSILRLIILLKIKAKYTQIWDNKKTSLLLLLFSLKTTEFMRSIEDPQIKSKVITYDRIMYYCLISFLIEGVLILLFSIFMMGPIIWRMK